MALALEEEQERPPSPLWSDKVERKRSVDDVQTGHRQKKTHPRGIESEVSDSRKVCLSMHVAGWGKSSEPKCKRARGPALPSAAPDAEVIEDDEPNDGKDEKTALPAPSPPRRQWQLIGRVENSHLIETVKHTDLIEFVRRHRNTFPCEVLTGAVVVSDICSSRL